MENEINITDDEMFSYDIENNTPEVSNKQENENKDASHESLIQPKSILYKVKDNDDITMVIIKTVVTLFIICFILPFIFIDLYIAYTDKTCVNDYPPKLKINLSLYLQINSYILIIVLSLYISMIYKKIQLFSCDEIMKTIFYLFMYVSRIIIFGWNILGAILFWGYIAENSNCSLVVYNYLYITFIIRLLIITVLISNTKNTIKEH